MSRIGKAPIPVPSGVDISVAERRIVVKGPKGSLERDLPGTIRSMAPSLPPKQVTGVAMASKAVLDTPSKTTPFAVTVQPLASVTVTK